MKKSTVLIWLATLCLLPAAASADGPELYFIAPADGAEIQGPVRIVFGLRGMGIAPAGVERANTGHHHLLVDTDPPPPSEPIPSDEHHRHFGGGQTETVLELAPGEHTLQLLLGDFAHRPHDPPIMSKRITIKVLE